MRIVQQYIHKGDVENSPVDNIEIKAVMTLDQRRKSRQRVTVSTGEDIGLSIGRGAVLRDGDVLIADDGAYILVVAATENLLQVTAKNSIDLTRAAYHLGNRHILLEIGHDYLQLEYDPVLEDMLQQLGGVLVAKVNGPFEPEIGAYGGGHKHGHDDTFAEDYALAQAAYNAHNHG